MLGRRAWSEMLLLMLMKRLCWMRWPGKLCSLFETMMLTKKMEKMQRTQMKIRKWWIGC